MGVPQKVRKAIVEILAISNNIILLGIVKKYILYIFLFFITLISPFSLYN